MAAPEQQSTILNVSVIAQHPQYAMTALALGDQQLWVNQLAREPGEAARIRIQASDVSLVLEHPRQTSIRNILRAQVVSCVETNGQIEVQLTVSGRTLWARISPWARDDLVSACASGCMRKLRACRSRPDYSKLRLIKSAMLVVSFSPITTFARALTSSTALPIATPVPTASSMLRSL